MQIKFIFVGIINNHNLRVGVDVDYFYSIQKFKYEQLFRVLYKMQQ